MSLNLFIGSCLTIYGSQARADLYSERPPEIYAGPNQYRVGSTSITELAPSDYSLLAQFSTHYRYAEYVSPNEAQPELSLSVKGSAPPGALVSVGSERCFMLAGAVSKITSAHCFDYDHGIYVFNLINTELLRLAKSSSDFLYLVKQAPMSVWKERLIKRGINLTDDRLPILFEYWERRVRHNETFEMFLNPPTSEFYHKMNYMYDQKQFSRLKYLAESNLIRSDWIDITNSSHVGAMVSNIEASGQKLSFLDTSNLFAFVDFPILASSILQFSRIKTNDQSRVILTKLTIDSSRFIYVSFPMNEESLRMLASPEVKEQPFTGGIPEPFKGLFAKNILRSEISCGPLFNCEAFDQKMFNAYYRWLKTMGQPTPQVEWP